MHHLVHNLFFILFNQSQINQLSQPQPYSLAFVVRLIIYQRRYINVTLHQ